MAIRDLTVAAPIEAGEYRCQHQQEHTIRDLTVAAPLKHGSPVARSTPTGSPIRDLTVAAPLKRDVSYQGGTPRYILSATSRSRPH